MRKTGLLLISALALLLSACVAATSGSPIAVTQNSSTPTPSSNSPGAYPNAATGEPLTAPYPGAIVPSLNTGMYPAPTGASTGLSSMPISSYAPQPGDVQMTRDAVILDLAATELVASDTKPKVETVSISGSLPDPCHQLRIVVTPPDKQNKINLTVYSVNDPQTTCIMVIQPFQVSVPLDNLGTGRFSVYINSQLLGEFVR